MFWQKSFEKTSFLGSIWLKSTKMSGFRGLNAKNVGIDGMDVFSEGLEVMVYVLWVGDENIRDVGRTADGIWSDGGRNPIGRRTESDRTADGARWQKLRFWVIEVGLWGYIYYVMGLYISYYGVVYIMLWVYIFIMCRGNWWGKGLDFVSKNLHTMRVLCRKRKYFALKMQFFAHFYW